MSCNDPLGPAAGILLAIALGVALWLIGALVWRAV